VLVEIRVKHPHQLLPKLFQPRRLLRVEFPFPLQRRCRGIVFDRLIKKGMVALCSSLNCPISKRPLAKY
jgi:hypothetical protein